MPKRELSCFLCRELLFEYVSDSIDSRRGEAVARHLGVCNECCQEQEGLKGAVSYLGKLSAVEIRPEYLKDISDPKPMSQILGEKLRWKSWPEPLRWTVESLTFAAIIAVFVGTVGQQLFRPKSSQVAEMPVVEHPSETVNVAQLPDQTPSEFGEDEFTDHENDLELAHVEPPSTNKTSTSSPTETRAAEASSSPNASESLTKNLAGFLYRTHLKVSDIEIATNELIQKIEELGGKKAGSVPIGWKRPTGSYFHFSMPEKNYSQLAEFLKKFGSDNIVKESNPRTMPKGTIRMILEVEGISTTTNLPTEPSQDSATPVTPPEDAHPPEATIHDQE